MPEDEIFGMIGACENLQINEEDPFHPQPAQFRDFLYLSCDVKVFEEGNYRLFLKGPEIWLFDSGLIRDVDEVKAFE